MEFTIMIDRLKKALNSALDTKSPEIVESIVKKGVKLDPHGVKLDPQRILNMLFEADRDCQLKPSHMGMFSSCNDWNHPRLRFPNKSEKNAEKWIRALIESKADVDTQHTKTGSTALMWASYQGFEGCVKLLLESKADPNKANRNDTAFEIAVRRDKPGCVQLLLDAMPNEEQSREKILTL